MALSARQKKGIGFVAAAVLFAIVGIDRKSTRLNSSH